MTERKEAWEHIAPELPPGAYRNGDAFCWGQWKSATPAGLWKHFRWHSGITRKEWAELNAPRIVREAAEAAGKTVVFVMPRTQGGECGFHVYGPNTWDGAETYGGPDICTAALATIKALGGGE